MTLETKIAIVASVSAIIGALIAQSTAFVLAWIDRRHKKQILLRQKYEEMMFHFQESLDYYNQVGTCETLDQLNACTSSTPAQKAMVLALIYFPELVAVLEDYVRYYTTYYQSIVSVFNEARPGTAGAQARVHDKGYNELEKKMFELKNRVIKTFVENANKYNKA